MTPEEQERLNELCRRVVAERDPQKFDELVKQMNDLLEKKYERIHPEHAK